MADENLAGTICCPEFNPVPWDSQFVEWDNKLFIKDKIRTIFYMPLNFGSVMTRLDAKLRKEGMTSPDWLCLSYHASKWKMDLFLAVDREIAGAENVRISGKFFTKVYEGSYRDMSKWHINFKESCEEQGYALKKVYTWYTTCPKCAKKYGKNYVVLLGELLPAQTA